MGETSDNDESNNNTVHTGNTVQPVFAIGLFWSVVTDYTGGVFFAGWWWCDGRGDCYTCCYHGDNCGGADESEEGGCKSETETESEGWGVVSGDAESGEEGEGGVFYGGLIFFRILILFSFFTFLLHT